MFRNPFDKNLETATSHLLLEPDWPSIIAICDAINQKDTTPKNAFVAIKKKMTSNNPHSAFYALLVLESVVKNCGTPMHTEVFTKENCTFLSQYLEATPHENVRAKMLELVQIWAYAFRKRERYQAIRDTMNILKTKGFPFPELKEADAMFVTDVAPNWLDGKKCNRCRIEFTFTNRKHHCRHCGQVFCGQCTSKFCPIPKYGIEKDVRVCDGCYALLQRRTTGKPATRVGETDLPAEYLNSSLAQQVQTPPRKTEQELKEEEELQLALALSQSEAESKKQQQQQTSLAGYRSQQRSPSPEAPSSVAPAKEPEPEETNPDLAKYMNRSYWEQRKVSESAMASPSAPSPMPATPQPQQGLQQQQLPLTANDFRPKDIDEQKMDEFAANMKSQIEIFVNRMKSNSSRGRSITNDSSVQTLFMTLTGLHSQQLSFIKELDDKRVRFEQLQDKLAQVKDSRAALDDLRTEHAEKLRQMAEEQERQRQILWARKLEVLRKKKQEYLQYQRQLALHRIQEQEREMQMHLEKQIAIHQELPMGYVNYGMPMYEGMGHNGPMSMPHPGQQMPGMYPNYMHMMAQRMPGMMPGMIPSQSQPPEAAGGDPHQQPHHMGGMPVVTHPSTTLPQQHQQQQQHSVLSQGPMMPPQMGHPMMHPQQQQQQQQQHFMSTHSPLPNVNQMPLTQTTMSPVPPQQMQQQPPHMQTQMQQQQPQPQSLQHQTQPQLQHQPQHHQPMMQEPPPQQQQTPLPQAQPEPQIPMVNPQAVSQIQAVQAAPAPPQNDPAPVAPPAPAEPATAELISFD